jgi:hypothetical protein
MNTLSLLFRRGAAEEKKQRRKEGLLASFGSYQISFRPGEPGGKFLAGGRALGLQEY